MQEITTEQIEAQSAAAAAFAQAAAILARLRAPGGCAWDRDQTLDSIKPHSLEELYEVFDAIDRHDWSALKDELGDLLLQVLFYAQIAHDAGHFGMAEVGQSLAAKLLRRHPHVFGDATANTPDEVIATWEAVKAQERGSDVPGRPQALLDRVSSAMPAFTEARKLGKTAASVGFDWPDTTGLLRKVEEEVLELRAEIVPGAAQDVSRVEEEFGDLLFVMTNLARHLQIDPEQALRKANAKFRRRFGRMEELSAGTPLGGQTLEELDALWNRAKEEERA